MAGLDCDVVIGSGFGGSVAALQAADKSYRFGVVESGAAAGQASGLLGARVEEPKGSG